MTAIAPDIRKPVDPPETPPPFEGGNAERLLILEKGRAERNYWSDLWHYRELFAILAWRDVSIRYKQTVIGVAWAVVRPLITMAIFTIVFGRLAKLPSDGSAPYALDVLDPAKGYYKADFIFGGA